MVYFTQQRGIYLFQMRVPRKHQAQFGQLIRVQLGTSDLAAAKVLSMHLAAQWLARFSGLELPVTSAAHPPSVADAALASNGSEKPDVGPALEPSMGPAPNAPKGPVPHAQTFLAIFEYWRDLNPSRPLRTIVEFEAGAEAFDRFIQRPIAQLDRRLVAAYRDALLARSLHPKTVTNKLSHLSAMLQAAVDAGLYPANPIRGLRVPQSEGLNIGRRAFSATELQAVFTSPVYSESLRTRGCGGEACVWLPALGLLTGCRLEELCQLRLRDIESDAQAGLLLHIRPDGAAVRVKNTSSIRTVPVHPELLRIGFQHYVDGQRPLGREWLFPDLRPDRFGKRSGTWSQWWGRYMRDRAGCNLEDRSLVFHGFRHTFKTICRAARIPEDVHDALTGHSSGQVGRRYGSMPLNVLVTAMRSIEPPISLPVILAD
ncbi:site-specific integrase [Thiomonas sp. X19]|uniref:tyrosine-type recombinase/integrase n=1 Tax=Thiomonas sp. X19 TaxID=1050370 RepID=UPI000DD8B382